MSSKFQGQPMMGAYLTTFDVAGFQLFHHLEFGVTINGLANNKD